MKIIRFIYNSERSCIESIKFMGSLSENEASDLLKTAKPYLPESSKVTSRSMLKSESHGDILSLGCDYNQHGFPAFELTQDFINCMQKQAVGIATINPIFMILSDQNNKKEHRIVCIEPNGNIITTDVVCFPQKVEAKALIAQIAQSEYTPTPKRIVPVKNLLDHPITRKVVEINILDRIKHLGEECAQPLNQSSLEKVEKYLEELRANREQIPQNLKAGTYGLDYGDITIGKFFEICIELCLADQGSHALVRGHHFGDLLELQSGQPKQIRQFGELCYDGITTRNVNAARHLIDYLIANQADLLPTLRVGATGIGGHGMNIMRVISISYFFESCVTLLLCNQQRIDEGNITRDDWGQPLPHSVERQHIGDPYLVKLRALQESLDNRASTSNFNTNFSASSSIAVATTSTSLSSDSETIEGGSCDATVSDKYDDETDEKVSSSLAKMSFNP